jgi:L-histidine N-alpha-methyltransferase
MGSLARQRVGPSHTVERMADEVRAGLAGSPPSLPCKYFYDEAGMRLFEEITELPEYYLTRTEHAILEREAAGIVARVRPRELVEIGSGTSPKLRLLLDAAASAGLLRSCVLLDISAPALARSAAALRARYAGLRTRAVVADFQEGFDGLGPGGGRLACFLGSTIGNLHPDEIAPFLRALRAHLSEGDGLLLGLDLVKDRARLEAAYNDAAGVTARFNLNLLQVMNDRLDADFDLDAFEHVAFYDEERAWIEMRLRARRGTRARLAAAGLELTLARGDELRTEISCKFTRASLEARLEGAGLRLDAWLSDPERLFALALLRPTPGR